MAWLFAAILVLFLSASLALLVQRRPFLTTTIGAVGAVIASILGLIPTVSALLGHAPVTYTLPWRIAFGPLALGMDPLSAFFAAPILVLGALAAVYGRTYLLPYRKDKLLGLPVCSFNLLLASMLVVVLARSLMLLLVAWEVMTLSSYLLVTFEHGEKDVRRAGLVYLVAAHVGVICLLLMVLLLDQKAGGLGFDQIHAMAPGGAGFNGFIFFLAIVGFGIKAGFLPFHVWLPEAHAAAPTHVSALMSGVMIKLGVYGLLRIISFLPTCWWWGPVLIVLGLSGALWGISQALVQRDLKRVLAYSSVENMGIIALALGLAFWRLSRGDGALAMLAACGGFLHMWNHVLMKGLMFFAAGSMVHACGTRDMERLGGLMKRMPKTGVIVVVGAIALAGLPPLNGFVGEWLIYFGLMGGGLSGGGPWGIAMLLASGLFALVGGLAALCFVRLVGIVLLGEGRSEASQHAHESTWGMLGPMAILLVSILLVGVYPSLLVRGFSGVLLQVLGAPVMVHTNSVAASLGILGVIHLVFWGFLVGGGVLLAFLSRGSTTRVPTWGCGYAAPTTRMQYTASAFSEMVSVRLLPRHMRALFRLEMPSSSLPSEGNFKSECSDPLIRGVYEPFFSRWADRFSRLRWVQQGALHIYILYIFIVAVVALAWISWSTWMAS
jgi:formate hydrogenlyase subunit 3/multisubunit Na+/H+ antiporter MnhD subunit